MIPELPRTVSEKEQLAFYDTLVGNLSDQSSVHVNWHTHRQNPSVCWICDLVTITSKIIYLADKNISKSALDIGTELSSEDDSDSEIEYDKDDDALVENTNEPEYAIEGEDVN